jgi:hypothetical protein
MIYRMSSLVALAVLASGCVATNYTLVEPGARAVAGLQVNATSGWNQAPPMSTPSMQKGAVLWTHDGPLLDQLIIIPGVADGEPLMKSSNKSAAMPLFKKDMLPNEIEELTESTFVKYFGEGNAVVTTKNLRPQRFGENRGVMFDVDATVSDSPKYRGTAGAFVANDKLYMMFFLGAVPHYFDKHAATATSVIQSAMLTGGSSTAATN